MATQFEVHFNFKHDVEGRDGARYICANLTLLRAADIDTGLAGDIQISVWIPFSPEATMVELREKALLEARKRAAAFSETERSDFSFGVP